MHKSTFKSFSLLLLSALMLVACKQSTVELPAYDKGINVTPTPVELSTSQDSTKFQFDKQTVFVVAAADNDSLQQVVNFVAEKMRQSTGLPLAVQTEEKQTNSIHVSVDPALMDNKEGYTLLATSSDIRIVGASLQGAYYGLQTLLQLLPAEIESSSQVSRFPWAVPAVQIKDYPRFAYRGILIDVCRHFLSVEEMKKQIDVLSMLKINKLHWHLTEDQGWRIEIKKYPKLTELGSTRKKGDGSDYGPYFYTQEEVKEIVAYAQERFVEVIPEIELPGHSMAALVAYPELACFPHPFEVRRIWGVEEDVYCAGKESVFEFLEDVLSEVIPLFPSQYFHIGGDECPKTQWKKCPLCQKRIRENGLKDEHELQSYFVSRIGRFLAEHGKAMIGWDEILEGGLAPSAIVMSWRGEEGGIEAANMEHNVIMTPSNQGLYIDHYQGEPSVEPTAIGGYAPIERTYAYNPLPSALPEEKHHYILGAQANLWSEYLYTPEQAEYMAYPRMIALAELTWSPLEKKDFKDFCRRLDNQCVRLDQHDMNYHIPIPQQEHGSLNHLVFMDSITVPFHTTRPIRMVYTTDGSEPNAESETYSHPLSFHESTQLKIAGILPSGVTSIVRDIEIQKVDSYAKGIEGTEDKASLALSGVYQQGLHSLVVPKAVSPNEELSQYEGDDAIRTVIHSQKEMSQPLYKEGSREYNFYGSLYEGFVFIGEDDIYVLSTRADKLWIDDELVIDNSKELARTSHNDRAMALGKGLHSIRLEMHGRIEGGWPTMWLDNRIFIKTYGSDKFEPIDDADLYYKNK